MTARKGKDAIALLDADHQDVKKLFKAYRELAQNQGSRSRRKALAEQICLALTLHTRLEEEIFYPPVRETLGDDDLLDEAEAGHAQAADLIAQILAMDPREALYDAKVTVLGEYIDRHVKEEREQLFSRVRRSGLDLCALGQRLQARRQALLAGPEALREAALSAMPS